MQPHRNVHNSSKVSQKQFEPKYASLGKNIFCAENSASKFLPKNSKYCCFQPQGVYIMQEHSLWEHVQTKAPIFSMKLQKNGLKWAFRIQNLLNVQKLQHLTLSPIQMHQMYICINLRKSVICCKKPVLGPVFSKFD